MGECRVILDESWEKDPDKPGSLDYAGSITAEKRPKIRFRILDILDTCSDLKEAKKKVRALLN